MGTDWSMYRGNMARTGKSDSILIPPLRVIWEFEPKGYIHHSPAITKEIMLFFGTNTTFYALSADTGRKIWEFPVGGRIYSNPAVDREKVYFGCHDKKFYAVDIKSGRKAWEFHSFTSEDEGDEFTHMFNSSPVLINDSVCIVDSSLFLLDAKRGKSIWQVHNPDGWTGSDPAVSRGILYVGLYRTLYAYDLNSRQRLWTAMPGGRIKAGPAISESLVYVGTSRFTLYALSTHTGEEVWEFQVPVEDTFSRKTISAPALNKNCVFFSSPDGKVYALDSQTGEEVWISKINDAVSSPVISGSVVYISSDEGILYALDAHTGRHLWEFDCETSSDSSPAICNDMLYVGGDKLYAFGNQVDNVMSKQTEQVSSQTQTEAQTMTLLTKSKRWWQFWRK